MCKKIICLLFFVFFVGCVRADLIAYYPFDGNANDMSGYGNAANGTLVGNPTYDAGTANFGQALKISSTSNYVNCGTDSKFDITGPMTVCAWIRVTSWNTNWNAVVTKGDSAWRLHRENATNFLNWTCSGTSAGGVTGTTAVNDDQWHFVAGVYDGANLILYLDGNVDAQVASTGTITTNTNAMLIAENDLYKGRTYTGWIDEVRIYNNALTANEVLSVMAGKRGLPSNPKPSGTEVSIKVGGISWKPGEFADTHNVFFGTNFDDVNEATVADHLGAALYQLPLDQNSIQLGILPYGTTYYWRVEEVNAPPSSAVISGAVWSFTTEPKGYKIPSSSIVDVTILGNPLYHDPEFPTEWQDPNDTCDGSGLIDANNTHTNVYQHNMLLLECDADSGQAWIQYEFDKVYMLSDMLIWNYNQESPYFDNFGAKDVNISYTLDVNDPDGWTTLPTVTLNMATGTPFYNTPDKVEFDKAIAKFVRITFLSSISGDPYVGLSEVRFLAEPTRAEQTAPANNATNQDPKVNLTWKPGRYADEYYLYISTDVNAVNGKGTLVEPIIVSDPNCVVPDEGLTLTKRYYWRVDEVNMADSFTQWDGSVRYFTVVANRYIERFEAFYGDADANAVWAIWGGYDVTGNGGEMGNTGKPYLSTTNHSAGNGHSAPFIYDNSGADTDSWVKADTADLPINIGSDWSIGSPTTLTIWFRGNANNVAGDDELYCTIGGKTAVYGGNLKEYITWTEWKQFDVNLVDLGVNLANITDIKIGIRKVGATGGKGEILLDDIQLTGNAPVIAKPSTFIQAEDAVSITAGMGISTGTTGFMGSGYITSDANVLTADQTTVPTKGIATYSIAITKAGNYRIAFRTSLNRNAGNSFWVKVTGPSVVMDQTIDPNNQGWANMNEITRPNFGPWTWEDVFDYPTGQAKHYITYTLTPGTYTLQIAVRERTPRLDAIEIKEY